MNTTSDFTVQVGFFQISMEKVKLRRTNLWFGAHLVLLLRYGSTISTKSLGALCPYPGMSTRAKALPTRKKFIFFV